MKKTLNFIVLFVLLCSCSSQKADGALPVDNILTASDVNQTIIVSAPDGWNRYKMNEDVQLLVELRRNTTVVIDEQKVQIYIFMDDSWISIKNGYGYPSTYVIEPSENPAKMSVQVAGTPTLEDKSKSVLLRFVVNGNIYENNMIGEKVQAYVDVMLYP